MVAVQKIMHYTITDFLLQNNLCFPYINWFISLLYI